MLAIISIILWGMTIVGFVIFNLLQKNSKLEQMVLERETTILNQELLMQEIRAVVEESSRVLKEVDKKGAFQGDDEVGFFFKNLLNIQEVLDNYFKK